MPNFLPYTRNSLEETRKTGVYGIFNLINNDWYVGSATAVGINLSDSGFYTRWVAHIRLLEHENKRHHSKKLQEAWDEYGAENFEFRILEFIEDENRCFFREQEYLDKYWDLGILYNSSRNVFFLEKGCCWNAKDYTFINPNGELIKVFNLRKYCLENDLSYPAMIGVDSGKLVQHQGWKSPKHPNRKPKDISKYWEFLDPNGNLVRFRNLTKFCRENGLRPSSMMAVDNGRYRHSQGWTSPKHKWVMETYELINPDGELIEVEVDKFAKFCRDEGLEKSAMFRILKNNHCKPYKGWTTPTNTWEPRIYQFISPDGVFVETDNLKKFSEENNLSARHMSSVWNKKRRVHKGWTRANYDYVHPNAKPRTFISPDGLEIYTPNLSELCREYGLGVSGMSAVATGKRRIYKGWTKAPEPSQKAS